MTKQRTRNRDKAGPSGDPTKASTPGPVKYRTPLAKGVAKLSPRDRGFGQGDELTGYGQGSAFGGASSTNVGSDSADLSDVPATLADDVRDALVKGGVAGSATADLTRTLAPGNVPNAFGHRPSTPNPVKIPTKNG